MLGFTKKQGVIYVFIDFQGELPIIAGMVKSHKTGGNHCKLR